MNNWDGKERRVSQTVNELSIQVEGEFKVLSERLEGYSRTVSDFTLTIKECMDDIKETTAQLRAGEERFKRNEGIMKDIKADQTDINTEYITLKEAVEKFNGEKANKLTRKEKGFIAAGLSVLIASPWAILGMTGHVAEVSEYIKIAVRELWKKI